MELKIVTDMISEFLLSGMVFGFLPEVIYY